MRTIERSSAFKRDYRRAKATPRHAKDLDSLVSAIVDLLLAPMLARRALRGLARTANYSVRRVYPI